MGPVNRELGILRPLAQPRHRPAERRLAAPEFPWAAPDDAALVLELRRVDLPTHVLDVHAILGEQGVVGELVGGIGNILSTAFLPPNLASAAARTRAQ